MTLNNLMIDKRIVQRNIEQGKLEPAEYQRILDALPDLSDKVWRRPAVSEERTHVDAAHVDPSHVQAARVEPAAPAAVASEPVAGELASVSRQVAEQMEIEAAYAGYLDRQEADILAFRKDEDLRLPTDLDYRSIGGLSNEAKEKLTSVRPATLGQAARIEGMTPGAMTAVLGHLKRVSKAVKAAAEG